MKIHIFGDEMTAIAASMMLGRPVKFVADRLEAFVTDVHARGHRVKARMALDAAGGILAIDVDDLYGIGPYSMYPRGSANEAKQVVNLTGAPYRHGAYRCRARVAFENKNLYAQYRAVGHPIAVLATEALADRAAAALAMDPAEFRRRNYLPADCYPHKLATGPVLERLSQHASLDTLLTLMDYQRLRAEQARLRRHGVHRGIGLASFVESSNPSSATYGLGGAPIASQDACSLRLTGSGQFHCAATINEGGQGTATVVGQIAAGALGVALDAVRVVVGDTEAVPFGGGNWGSRGTGIGGEAVWQAGRALRANLLAAAARLLGCMPGDLDLRGDAVVDARNRGARITLAELAQAIYFRTDRFGRDFQPEPMVTRSFAQKHYDGVFTNGIQAAWVEVDAQTGFVRLLKHWVVDDCGVVINPLLADEQIRGACVQGIGMALSEQILYDAAGQVMNGSLIDYLVPMAVEMPDIEVGHVCTPTATSELGAKGAGEAGAAGAPAAIFNAVNDALAPLGARVDALPITPANVLAALGVIDKEQDK